MSDESKDLQKRDKSFLEQMAHNDSLKGFNELTKAGAGLMLVVSLIAGAIGYAYGLPFYLYIPLGALVFCLLGVGYRLFVTYPHYKQLQTNNGLDENEIDSHKPKLLPSKINKLEVEPNILVVDSYTAYVKSQDGVWHENITGQSKGVLVKFVNEPTDKQQVGKLRSVIAQIFFYDSSDCLLRRVDETFWLEASQSVWFKIGTTQRLLICYKAEQLQKLWIPDRQHTKPGLRYGSYNIIIRLVADNQWQNSYKFQLHYTKEGEISINYVGETKSPT